MRSYRRPQWSPTPNPLRPLSTRSATRAIARSAEDSHKKKRCTSYPDILRLRSQGAKDRLASVVSNAKSTRCAASSLKRASIIRPAAIATRSGSKADSPPVMTSAFTNSPTASAPCSSAGATVDFPAPFGPARMTTLGCRSLTYPVRRHACLTRSSSFCWRSVTQDASRAWL